MRKLLAILLCLALTVLPGFAEGTAIPGFRVTFDQFSVTIGEESFSPDMKICLDEAYDEQSQYAGFFLELGGSRLLPVQAKVGEEGLSVKLGNSSVYCFAPEMAGLETVPAPEGELPDYVDIAYDFVEYLDGFEETEFELQPLEILAWLEGELHLEEGDLRQVIRGFDFPLMTAKRDSLGYTLAVGDSEPMYFTLRTSDQWVSLSAEGLKLIVRADRGIQASLTVGYRYEEYATESETTTFRYEPKTDGSADYSFDYKSHTFFEEEIYSELSGDVHLNVTGGCDVDGVHDAKVSYREEYEGIPDIIGSLHVSAAPAQVEDGIAGAAPVMIESEEGSGLSSLMFAAMGLFSDVERLTNDPVISGIMKAYGAQEDAYLEVYMRGFDTDYPYYGMLNFETPEFGWMPQGVRLEQVTAEEDSVQYEFAAGEDGQLFIIMETVDEFAEQNVPLSYDTEGNGFAASIVEDGVMTTVRSENIVLTESEITQILDGRIWIGEGYGTDRGSL